MHGAQPKFTIREIHDQITAAVRLIRHHASEYRISPNRIGIMGGSAGGHLSLMQGTHGLDGKVDATDPSDESSRVQALVAYCGLSDFVNYGATGVSFDEVIRDVVPDGGNPFLQAFDYFDFDAKAATTVAIAAISSIDQWNSGRFRCAISTATNPARITLTESAYLPHRVEFMPQYPRPSQFSMAMCVPAVALNTNGDRPLDLIGC